MIDPSFKEPSSEDDDNIDDNLNNDASVEAPVPPVPAANPVVRRSIRNSCVLIQSKGEM